MKTSSISRDSGTKPSIIVVASGMSPTRGSEPAKGWCWSSALSRYFNLHIITEPNDADECRSHPLAINEGWKFYPTEKTVTTWRFPQGYIMYHSWLQEALQTARHIIKENPISGLCHVVLGSFRVLPAYHTLGIPYSLGPLGGGECSPSALVWDREAPLSHKLTETFRPLLNNSAALVPALRSCMKHSAVALATSEEGSVILKRMGANNVAVVFSDSYNVPIQSSEVLSLLPAKQITLKQRIHLLWQGRPLWWKCPDLAIELTQRAVSEGIPVKLSMVSDWKDAVGIQIRKLVEKANLGDSIELLGYLNREAYLKFVSEQHAFVGTSIHDSGGIPLVEAQAKGLPCLTLGLGGNRIAACPNSGVPASNTRNEFIETSLKCLKRWHADPATWAADVESGLAYSKGFTNDRLEGYVAEHIYPAFARR